MSTVENKIPDVSTLVKKIDCGTRISKIKIKATDHNHGKYITTPEFDKLTVEVFSSRLVQENLITKNISTKKICQIKQSLYWFKMS